MRRARSQAQSPGPTALGGLWALGFGLALTASAQTPSPPAHSYLFFVASEAADQLALVRFGPKGALVEHRTGLKLVPGDPAGQPDVYVAADGRTHLLSSAHGLPDSELATGPRNIAVAPDGRTYYVTTAHGFAGGELLKMRIAGDSSHRESQPPDTLKGREPLGARPGAVEISSDANDAWVTNAPLHDAAAAGWVAVVYLGSMVEVARIPTCGLPAASRLTADGSKHYSVCRLDDMLVEVDGKAMKISRRLPLLVAGQPRCMPSDLAPGADGSRIYVACEGSSEVLEINAASWSVVRRIPVGAGPGAIALTTDGRMLVVADRERQAVSLIDAESGTERARIETPVDAGLVQALLTLGSDSWPPIAALVQWPGSRVPMQVALSPDDRYAFVTISRPDRSPGTVQIIDLTALRTVATIDVGPKADGIGFWKMEP